MRPIVHAPSSRTPGALLTAVLATAFLLGGCQASQNALHGVHDDLLYAAAALDTWASRLPTVDAPRHPHTPNATNMAAHPSLWIRPAPPSPYEREHARVTAAHLGH